jgi:hypothetical protein
MTKKTMIHVCLRLSAKMNKITKEIHADPILRGRLMDAFAREGRPLTRQALHQWRGYIRGVPASRVLTVARVMGLNPYQIRPDVFPKPRG